MGDDNIIGSITGTATFEAVDIEPHDDEKMLVRGQYHQSETNYTVPRDHLFICGAKAQLNEGTLSLHAEEGNWLYVQATEDDLRITKENPENDND